MSKDFIKEIKKNTRRRSTADEEIHIVLEGFRGEIPTNQLFRREQISFPVCLRWSKEFLEAGKNGLIRQTKRSATDDEVKRLHQANEQFKVTLTEVHMEVIKYKKNLEILQ